MKPLCPVQTGPIRLNVTAPAGPSIIIPREQQQIWLSMGRLLKIRFPELNQTVNQTELVFQWTVLWSFRESQLTMLGGISAACWITQDKNWFKTHWICQLLRVSLYTQTFSDIFGQITRCINSVINSCLSFLPPSYGKEELLSGDVKMFCFDTPEMQTQCEMAFSRPGYRWA